VRRPDREPLHQGLLSALILLLVAAVAPHFLHLHIWITLFFLAAVALRIVCMLRPRLLPGRLLLFTLALAGVANVILNYPVLISGETAIALMTSMVGLKLLEIHTRRDLFIVVFIGFFLLATQFLFNQDMLMVGYVTLLTTALTGVLLENSRHRPSGNPARSLGTALTLLLQAIPVMLVLFVFFPRLAGPIWALDSHDTTGQTGLSDSITMGSISNLVLSRAVAFRVDFNGPTPEPPRRYWRGPILWDTDGKRWTRGEEFTTRPADLQQAGAPIRYFITLEPTGNRWLMVLDLPDKIPPEGRMLGDYQVVRKEPVRDRIRYVATSRLRYNTGRITPEERARGLQLPVNITPRMQRLVRGWQVATDNNHRDMVNLALGYFRNREFYYTLRPPTLGDNPVDRFLFESRRGFCEHYATSFTLLMRLAGIPARIVTGYQGGEYNPLGEHLVVRQSDAHAWSEVWLPGSGWIRVDPTAAVAPERIERSFEFDQDFSVDLLGAPVRFGSIRSGLMAEMLKQLRWGADAINASWHRWVLGYTSERQNRLMHMLGLEFLKGHRLAYAMAGFGAMAVLLLGLALWYHSRNRVDAVYADYLRFCTKLKRRGLARSSTEGPLDYLTRIRRKRPDIGPVATRITRLYIRLRYGRPAGRDEQRSFHAMVRQFRP
jgi:protein-glutamine gamma-glutamyltransferase